MTLILFGRVVTSDVGPGLYAFSDETVGLAYSRLQRGRIQARLTAEDDVVVVESAAFNMLCLPFPSVAGNVDRFRAAFARALTAVRLTLIARVGIILGSISGQR